jgi:hypothetical protein
MTQKVYGEKVIACTSISDQQSRESVVESYNDVLMNTAIVTV